MGSAVPLLIWEVASRAGLLHSVFTPPFTQAAMKVLTLPAESPTDFVVTAAEILVALLATGLCGMTLGIILARSERIDALLGGLIWFLYEDDAAKNAKAYRHHRADAKNDDEQRVVKTTTGAAS